MKSSKMVHIYFPFCLVTLTFVYKIRGTNFTHTTHLLTKILATKKCKHKANQPEKKS